MISVDEIIEQIDQESDREDNLSDLEETENVSQENEDKNATKIQPKQKRIVGSRPKLDAERLKGPRGLICMEKLFSDLKFNGHGYEKQDLNLVMSTLQYWSHRLFPKYTFDDCLAQLERLGTKKPVITLKKKILYDMIEDLLPHDPDVIDEEVAESQQELNQFDMLLNQEPTPTFTPQPVITANAELTEEQKEMIARNRQLAAERRQARLDAMKEKQEDLRVQSSQTSPTNSQTLNLTEEQRLIIQKNRLLALEKRRQLHNKLNVSASGNTCPSQIKEASTSRDVDDSTGQENETEKIDDFKMTEEKISDFSSECNLSQNLNETEMDVNLESEILSQDSGKSH